MRSAEAWLSVGVLFSSSAFAQDVTPRYPSAARPQLAIENLGNKTVRLTTRSHPNLVIDFFEADSPKGPWLYSSPTPYVPGSQKFFRAAVNLNWVRLNEYYMVSTTVMAVRVTNPSSTPEFTTQGGFHLQMERPEWVYGISIFRIVDGPSTGDLVSDYQRLKQDLLADERTQFVSSASAGSCILGQTDILRLNKGTVTAEQMAQFNLELVADEPNIVVARWTKAKSMGLEAFERILNSAGIAGGFTSVGCADFDAAIRTNSLPRAPTLNANQSLMRARTYAVALNASNVTDGLPQTVKGAQR